MQPPFKQPLQAKGQPEVDKSDQNNPPVANSPTKAGQASYHDTRTASQLCPQEMIPLPLPATQDPNVPYFPSHSEYRAPAHGSISYNISERSLLPACSVYGSPIKSVQRSNPGKWYGISGFPVTDGTSSSLSSVPGATTSTSSSYYTSTMRHQQHQQQQQQQRAFDPHALQPQHAQLSRPTPQVPVTKPLFVSVPLAPLSCPPTSPMVRMTASAKWDPPSPSKRTVSFQFEGKDSKQIEAIIGAMKQAAEKHSGDTFEVIPPIKLQDPPLSKIKRRRSSESDNVPPLGNSSKAGSPIKSKCIDASASNPKEPPLPAINNALEDANLYDGLERPMPNIQLGKHIIRDFPYPGGNTAGSESPTNRSESMKLSKGIEPASPRPSSSVAKIPPSLTQSSQGRPSPGKKSRDPGESRRALRYHDPVAHREYGSNYAKPLEENNRSKENDCVSIILNKSREPTTINALGNSVGLVGNSLRRDDSLFATKETMRRQECRYAKEKSSSRKIARDSESSNKSPPFVLQKGRTVSPHGCDEVDGMDTPMDCDDNNYNYNQMYTHSSFATPFNQASNLYGEYQRMHRRAMTSDGYITDDFMHDNPSFKRESDNYVRQTSHGFTTTPIQSQTSTSSRHSGSHGSHGQIFNPITNERARDHHAESSCQSFTQSRNFFSKPVHTADIPSSPSARRIYHNFQEDRTLHSDFRGGYRQISSVTSRVPYKTDPRGRIVVEPEQVEDTSTDIVNIFESDGDSPNHSTWSHDQRSRTKDFNNNGSTFSDSCHVVTTRADTNVHFINPTELSDSSSMSCDDRSDQSNTSLPQEDCVPEGKFSRFYRHDETDGGSIPKRESETVQRRCRGKETIVTPAEDYNYNPLLQTTLAKTSCKALHSSAEDILSNNWRKTPVAYKSRSEESILSDKIDAMAPGSEFAEHTKKRFDPTSEAPSHNPSVSRQSRSDHFTNSIFRIKTFENLSAIQPKTLTDTKKVSKKLHPEKRAGFLRIKEKLRKQKGAGYEKRKSWSSSLPRSQTTNNYQSSPKKKLCSRSLDDLFQQYRYQEKQSESDGDEFDEVDGLGDGDNPKPVPSNSLERLEKHERSNRDNREEESDVVHCFDEPDDARPQSESDIVSCFDENLDRSSQSNRVSVARPDVVGRNKDTVAQNDFQGRLKSEGVVHCMTDDDTEGIIKNRKQQKMPATSSTINCKRSKDRYEMEDDSRDSRGQNYTQNTYIFPEYLTAKAVATGKTPSFNDHSCGVDKRLQAPSKSMPNITSNAEELMCGTFEDEKTHDHHQQVSMYRGDQRVSTSSSLAHLASDNINPHSLLRSYSLESNCSSLYKEAIDNPFDVNKAISSEQVRFRRHPEDRVCRSIQFDDDPLHRDEPKIEQTQLNLAPSSDIEMELTGLGDPSPNDREIVMSQVPNISHPRDQCQQIGRTPRNAQAASKAPKFHRPWLPSPPTADSNDDTPPRLLREPVMSTFPRVYSRSLSDKDEPLPFSETSLQQQQLPLNKFVQTADTQQFMASKPVPFLSSKDGIKDAECDRTNQEHPLPSTSIVEEPPKCRIIADMTSNLQNHLNCDPKSSFAELDNQMLISTKSDAYVFGGHSNSPLKKASSGLLQQSSSSPLKSHSTRPRDLRGPESSKRPKTNVIKSTKRSAIARLDFGQSSILTQPSACTSGEHEYSYQRQECSRTFDPIKLSSQNGANATTSDVSSGVPTSQFKSDVITGCQEYSASDSSSSNLGKRPERKKDEIDVRIQVTDVMQETRSLGQRLEEIYQSNRGECECARVEQEVLQTALDMFGKLCAAPETQVNFSQELRKTNKVITDALEVAQSLRQLCRHGRQVSDVLPGSVILRLKCKTVMAVLDLWRMLKDGELHVLLHVILGMRNRKLAPGLTLRVSIDEANVKTCLGFLFNKVSLVMRLSTAKTKSCRKKSPAKRVVKSTENLLSSPTSPSSPRSVHERWSSTPVLSTRSPLTSPMYVNSPSFPVYRRERKFSFGDSTRNAFQELNLSDTDSPSSSVKDDHLLRPDFLFRRIRSPGLMTSPPSTAPLTPPIRLKRCDVIQEQENIIHYFCDDDGWVI